MKKSWNYLVDTVSKGVFKYPRWLYMKTKFEKDVIFGKKKILFSDILRLDLDKRYE